jgi:hypothetical protein
MFRLAPTLRLIRRIRRRCRHATRLPHHSGGRGFAALAGSELPRTRKTTMIRRFAAAALLALTACGGGDADWTGTVRDSAGIAIVENPATGLWDADDAPAITQEVDIGTADGPPETQFGMITGITTDSEGRIYVLDQQAKKVRAFEADGRFIREMGGEGSGPGEMSQGAAGLLRLAGDTLIVADLFQQRVNLYTPDGTALGSFPMMMVDGVPVRWDVTPDDRIVHQLRKIPLGPAAPGAAEEPAMGTVGDPILVRGLDGSVLDTIAVLPPGKTITGGPGQQMRMRIFESEPVWDLAPDGRLYMAVNDDYRIHVTGPDGRLERIITRPFERRPFTEADRAQMMAALRDMWAAQGVPPQAMSQVEQMVGFADFFPAFASVLAAPGNQLWVQRVQTPEELAASGGQFDLQDLGANEWDAFDARGRYLGVVELPERFTPVHAEGDLLYGILRDELDVQHVVRLRVSPVAT